MESIFESNFMDGIEILEYLLDLHQEWNLQKLLNAKGYSDPNDDDFGLNSWTKRLFAQISPSIEEQNSNIVQQPNHIVSYLSVPSVCKDDLNETFVG